MQGSNSPEVKTIFAPSSSHKKYGMPPATFLLFISSVARQITPPQIQQLSIFVAWALKSRENLIDQALYEGANYGLERIELRRSAPDERIEELYRGAISSKAPLPAHLGTENRKLRTES